jgi:purine-binding chemotaxis protein CheW
VATGRSYEPEEAPAWDEPQEPVAQPQWEEPGEFDPAAVILQGRHSANDQEVVRDVDQEAEASLELLCFRVASEDYAISIMDIKEIIKPREVTEVPRVPPFVRGILSLRGIIIPVFDMRLRLGLPAGERSERERIVVVKRQGGFCGVLVDQVVQVVRIAETKLEAPPVVLEGIDREFVLGIGRVAGRMLILLDMEKVLDISLL